MELGPGCRGESAITSSGKEVAEADYMQRIMRSLTDSPTSSQAAAVPSQSNEEGSGIGSSSYTRFNDSYGRIPEISPGLNPWTYFPPPPELRVLVVDRNSTSPGDQPNWRPTSTLGSPQILSPIQREILADFPWLIDELDNWSLINSSTTTSTTGAASSSEVSFPRLASSKEESNACSLISALNQPSEQLAWAQSILELQAHELNSTAPGESLPATRELSKARSPLMCFDDPALSTFPDQSTSVTPENSETPFNSESLSSSLSCDGEADLKKHYKSSRNLGHGDVDNKVAGTTSAQSGKRKREQGHQQDGDDVRSDDQETNSKKSTNRPRKKGGVKRVREPRYAIKTKTDTEVMDDGYKWRKYGQKAVKNSPHPRNYYRCTAPSCPVRKRVERCLEDPGLVMTTYEGTHTHQSPSFLRGPGGLEELLATLSHYYALAGHPPLPRFHHMSAGFPPQSKTSDLAAYQASPLSLSQLQSQGSNHENLNLLHAHEQLLRLQQQEAPWANSSIKSSEPAALIQTSFRGPSFSSVSSRSDISYDCRMSHCNSTSVPDQVISGSHAFNPLDQYNSLISGAGPFSTAHQQPQPQPPNFGRRPEQYAEAGAGAAPSSQDSTTGASSDHQGGLLEDMVKSTKLPISRSAAN